ATGAMIDSFTQRHLLSMVTSAALLRRIGRIDFDKDSPSFFRFGGHSVKELRPCRVTNALGQTMVMHHPIDVQVFHADDTETVYDLARLLMGEGISSEGNPFVNSGDGFAVLLAFRCFLCQFTMLALHLCQCLFLLAKEFGVGYLFTGR